MSKSTSKKTYAYKNKDGQKLKAVVQWVPTCMGVIGLIHLYEGEEVITVFMSGGHYLNWMVVGQIVDSAFRVVRGPQYLPDHKKNWKLLQAAVKKMVGKEAWEVLESEFPDDPEQFGD